MAFLNYYQSVDPTILTGWNIDFFDIPYLYNRIKRVCGEGHAKRLSRIGQTFYSPYRQKWSLGGVSILDYINLYKNYNYGLESSYTLNHIATKELGRGKIEYEGSLDDLFETDLEKFIEYNITDVELVVSMDEKLQFIELCRAICHAGFVPYEDYMFSSKYLEGACLAYLKKKGLVAPNKPKDRKEKMQALRDNNEEKFIGAYVKEPIVGKYDWIYDLDLTSLYPSIIMTLNISPETKIGKIKNWDAEEWVRGGADAYTIVGNGGEDYDYTKEELKEVIKDSNLGVAANGVLYSQDKPGLIADILDTWFSQRVEFRKLEKQYGEAGDTEKYEFYAKRQLVQKILLNSMYGVLGLPAFRFYDIDNAEAVTITGQTVIKKTAEMANIKYWKELGTKEDYNVYIDTDSIYMMAEPLVKHRYPEYKEFDEKYKQQQQKVLPSISDDLKAGATKATIFALIAICLYIFIRFRDWRYSLGTIFSLLHDVLVTLIVFSFLREVVPFPLEIDQHFIAAILTVIGFSMNDTVIVYDRIREDSHLMKGVDNATIINKAINQTLSRTIMTSLTVFLTILILFIFGGEVTRGFAFAMLIGVVTGTYSSIFVAAPVLVDFAKNKPLGTEPKAKKHSANNA